MPCSARVNEAKWPVSCEVVAPSSRGHARARFRAKRPDSLSPGVHDDRATAVALENSRMDSAERQARMVYLRGLDGGML
eukprot:7385014-Prymnesium_polylepis.2